MDGIAIGDAADFVRVCFSRREFCATTREPLVQGAITLTIDSLIRPPVRPSVIHLFIEISIY